MSETFRLCRLVKYHGMAFSAIFLAALTYFLAALTYGFKGEHSVAIGLVVSGAMLFMSMYIWAAYYVERFTVDGTTLSIRSIFQDRRFHISELRRVTWRTRPISGSIVFHTFGSKARLDLYGYAKDDRLRIIRTVYDLVPRSLQHRWPEFCHQIALPLRDDRPALARIDPSAELFLITRKRYDSMAAFAFPFSIIAAIAIWALLNWWQFLTLPFVVIAAWSLLRFSVPRKGGTEVHLTSTPGGRGALIGGGGMVCWPLAMVVLGWLGIEKSIVWATAFIVMVTGLVGMLYLFYKSDKQRRSIDEQVYKAASELWERGEPSPTSNARNDNL